MRLFAQLSSPLKFQLSFPNSRKCCSKKFSSFLRKNLLEREFIVYFELVSRNSNLSSSFLFFLLLFQNTLLFICTSFDYYLIFSYVHGLFTRQVSQRTFFVEHFLFLHHKYAKLAYSYPFINGHLNI